MMSNSRGTPDQAMGRSEGRRRSRRISRPGSPFLKVHIWLSRRAISLSPERESSGRITKRRESCPPGDMWIEEPETPPRESSPTSWISSTTSRRSSSPLSSPSPRSISPRRKCHWREMSWSPRPRRRSSSCFPQHFGEDKHMATSTLFMVFNRAGKLALHHVNITSCGRIIGQPFDEISTACPLPCTPAVIDGYPDYVPMSWALCAESGSKLYAFVGDRPFPSTYQSIVFDLDNLKPLTIDPIAADLPEEVFSRLWLPELACSRFSLPRSILIPAFGSTFLLALSTHSDWVHWASKPYPHDFKGPTRPTWKSLPPPPAVFLSQTSSPSVTGCVVLEEHNLILFSLSVDSDDKFYSFNVITNEWTPVGVKKQDHLPGCKASSFDPLYPYGFMEHVGDGVIWPFFGKAEFLDGVIYGCFLRSIITYRVVVEEGCVLLEEPFLYRRAKFNPASATGMSAEPVFDDFERAPAFIQCPVPLPDFHSRRITHLGNNMFCVVEVPTDIGVEFGDVGPVYITTFLLSVSHYCSCHSKDRDEDRGFIYVLDSTVRALPVNGESFELAHCFSRREPIGMSSTATLHTPNYKQQFQDMIKQFCYSFLVEYPEKWHHGQSVRWRLKYDLDMIMVDPTCRFVAEYLHHMIRSGPEPDPLLLVEKGREICDSDEKLFNERSYVSMLFYFANWSIAWYEMEISETGGICGDGIVPFHSYEGHAPSCVSIFDGSLHTFLIDGEGKDPDLMVPYRSIRCNAMNMKSGMRLDAHSTFPEMRPLAIGLRNLNFRYSRTPPFLLPKWLRRQQHGPKYCFLKPIEDGGHYSEKAFQYFDTLWSLWRASVDKDLEMSPEVSSKHSDVCGYVVTNEHILVSLEDGAVFYCNNIKTGEWRPVLTDKGGEYIRIVGKAEYVDGEVYVYHDRQVWRHLLSETDNGLYLHDRDFLADLDFATPPIPWKDGMYTECMIHLGNKAFYVVEALGFFLSDYYVLSFVFPHIDFMSCVQLK